MRQEKVTVCENIKVADNTFKMTVKVSQSTLPVRPGQFLSISTGEDSNLLKRPFAIAASTNQTLTFYYLLKGSGTKTLSQCAPNTTLEVLYPQGNGFNIKPSYNNIALVGGGAGIFALVNIINQNKNLNIDAFFGYKTSTNICLEHTCIKTVTDDGTFGEKSNAVDSFLNSKNSYDVVFACGPTPMLKYLQNKVNILNIKTPVYVSLEERMGCGIGACLVCTCDKADGTKARVCCDGPVFSINEVNL